MVQVLGRYIKDNKVFFKLHGQKLRVTQGEPVQEEELK